MIIFLLSLMSGAADLSDAQVANKVHEAMAARHMDSCDAVRALGNADQVRAALIQATEHQAPPWAPLRAAGCLTEFVEADPLAMAHARALLRDKARPGFVLAITEKLDVLPSHVALELAETAWVTARVEPRLTRRVQSTLQSSTHASVRAVLK
ncbi:MAG: hypothetical protein AB8H79_24490 [Myxococcota bacterium]